MKKQMKKSAVAVLGLAMIIPLSGSSQGFTTMPNVFGGQNFFSGGQLIGTSMPNVFGGFNFRGSEDSVLFASDEVSKQFSEEAWVDAVQRRNVQDMISCAWNLKKVETILGRKDTKTTSGALFEAAAQIAVGQRNAESLGQIVALEPGCKKYMEELKASGATRGGAGSSIATPELVYPDFKMLTLDDEGQAVWQNALNTLKPYQTPHLRPDMVLLNFRGMSTPDAENVSFLLNRGRTANDPKLLVQGAIALAAQPVPPAESIFSPMRIMNEAAELAIVTQDRIALSLVVDVLKSDAYGLKSAEKATLYGEELKLMGGTRGFLNLGGGTVTIDKLLRPPYRLDMIVPENLGINPMIQF